MSESNINREEDPFNSSIPSSASTYTYRDHSQERSEPLWFDQRFENLFQTADQKRKLPAKLNAMLSDPELSSIITWLPHGRSWRIIDRHNFINIVLPAYFDHNKYTSFIRLVNAWGFRRIPSGVDRDSYYHELFLRGMPHLHLRMRRLVSHESKAPVDDENRFPNFYEMPLLDEVTNFAAPVQPQNSAMHDSTSSNNSRAHPQSDPRRSEGRSSASTSTAPAILGIGLPNQYQKQPRIVNSLGMARQTPQQLRINSNNPALLLPSGGNPLMQQSLSNTLFAAQPCHTSLVQTHYQQLPQQHQQENGQQINDFQSATYAGHLPFQANGSVNQASTALVYGAIADATNHGHRVQQQHSQVSNVPSVFISEVGANAFDNLDQVTPDTTQQYPQQQQMLQLLQQQNLSSHSPNQQIIMMQHLMQGVNQHHQVRGPHLSLSAPPVQLNSSRSMARSSTFPTFLQGGISNSSGQDFAGYPGFITTASNDCFSRHDSSSENPLSILPPLARAPSTLVLNNVQQNNSEKAPDDSSKGR